MNGALRAHTEGCEARSLGGVRKRVDDASHDKSAGTRLQVSRLNSDYDTIHDTTSQSEASGAELEPEVAALPLKCHAIELWWDHAANDIAALKRGMGSSLSPNTVQ